MTRSECVLAAHFREGQAWLAGHCSDAGRNSAGTVVATEKERSGLV